MTAALMISGCVVSPQPEPPGLDSIAYRANALEGAPGTVDPPEGRLWVIDPFATTAPVEVPVQSDGSFGPFSWTTLEGLTRAEVRVEDSRSAPVEFVRGAGDTAVPRELLFPCATVAMELDFEEVETGIGETIDLLVENGCADDLQVSADFTGFRFEDRGFAIDPLAGDETVPAGGSLTLPITFTPPADGFTEDFLTVDLRSVGGDRDWRFVTVVGRGI